MNIVPVRNFGEQDHKEMFRLIDPDNNGNWAVRYLWIQHLDHNDDFYDGYFSGGNRKGLNVRKNTEHLQGDWSLHNKIFEDSGKNGDLVWRVKIGNDISKSIDYIEVWRTKEILLKYFGDRDIEFSEKTKWNISDRREFAERLFESGFDIRYLSPYPTISKKKAIDYYQIFLERFKNKQNCIINTAWNPLLNPLE